MKVDAMSWLNNRIILDCHIQASWFVTEATENSCSQKAIEIPKNSFQAIKNRRSSREHYQKLLIMLNKNYGLIK